MYFALRGISMTCRRVTAVAALAAALLASAPPSPAADTKAMAAKVKEMFKGKASLYGRNILRIAYDFSDKEQLEDFKQGCKGEIVDGQLELRPLGSSLSFWNVKGAVFANYVSVEADVTLMTSNAEAGMLAFFSFKKGEGYGFTLNGNAERARPSHYVRRYGSKRMGGHTYWDVNDLGSTSRPPLRPKVKYRWKAVARQGVLQMTINRMPVMAKQDTAFREGYLCLSASRGKVRFDNVKIEGAVNPDWLRKAVSEAETIAARETNEDLQEKKKPSITRLLPLSVESRTAMAKVDAGATKSYEAGRKLQLMRKLDDAIEKYTSALRTAPAFVAALYRRAECHWARGDEAKAEEDLDAAIAKDPGFYEAIKDKGDIFMRQGLYAHALAQYDKALKVKGDYGAALAARALLQLAQGDREKAMKTITEAAATAPEDDEVKRTRRMLKNVTEGPPWAKEKTFVKETSHYIVKTDISQRAAVSYAAHLEAIYGMYMAKFGYRARQKHKARAYIFETREGYLTYAELSTSDRPETSLGYYHPLYRELLIFEGLDKELTHRVLYHEGFHQFLHQFMATPPYWFNEGVAEFFGATRIANGRVVATGLIQEGRLRTAKAILGTKYCKSFSDLLKSSSRRSFYGGYVAANYAQAWTVIHFFFGHQNGRYAPLLRNYYKALRDGRKADDAYKDAFGRANMLVMEKEWQDYVRNLQVPRK
jgi:tetratricopeptide (TPR) repeat protein